MIKTVATIPGINAPPSWPSSVLMAMPSMAMDCAAAIDIKRGLRPSRSIKNTDAAVANMKSTAFPVARTRDASSGKPTLLCKTRGR